MRTISSSRAGAMQGQLNGAMEYKEVCKDTGYRPTQKGDIQVLRVWHATRRHAMSEGLRLDMLKYHKRAITSDGHEGGTGRSVCLASAVHLPGLTHGRCSLPASLQQGSCTTAGTGPEFQQCCAVLCLDLGDSFPLRRLITLCTDVRTLCTGVRCARTWRAHATAGGVDRARSGAGRPSVLLQMMV